MSSDSMIHMINAINNDKLVSDITEETRCSEVKERSFAADDISLLKLEAVERKVDKINAYTYDALKEQRKTIANLKDKNAVICSEIEELKNDINEKLKEQKKGILDLAELHDKTIDDYSKKIKAQKTDAEYKYKLLKKECEELQQKNVTIKKRNNFYELLTIIAAVVSSVSLVISFIL